jgi:hypothetical protein
MAAALLAVDVRVQLFRWASVELRLPWLGLDPAAVLRDRCPVAAVTIRCEMVAMMGQ